MTKLDKIVLTLDEIKVFLPHRHPLLLLDAVHELEAGQKVVSSKFLAENDPVFAGHFPGNPIYPGVYYIEAIAQTGAILAFATRLKNGFKDDKLGVLTSIEDARFRRPGVPGETVVYSVSIEKTRGPFWWLKGAAYINDELAAECNFSIAIGTKKGK